MEVAKLRMPAFQDWRRYNYLKTLGLFGGDGWGRDHLA